MKSDFSIGKTDALIIVDLQNDFCPGGALPVPKGDQVIPVLNDYIKTFKKINARIFVTRDWHPPNHTSFKAQGGPWQPHCIQNTEGANFHPDLKLPNDAKIISKATNSLKEAYSGFDGTELASKLKEQGVTRVFVGGIETDYCVRNTVLDARKLGFKTVLLLDAVRGINIKPNDIKKAINEMIENNAEPATLEDFPEPLEALPAEDFDKELLARKSLMNADTKKKARMRPRGRYKRICIEK